ncbi:hypothetical protein D3C74_72770 [compost metagenome]
MSTLILKKYSKSEIKEYLTSLNIPSVDIQNFVDNWTSEDAHIIADHIIDYLKKLEIKNAIKC